VKNFIRAISGAKIVLAFFDTNVLVYCTDSSAEKNNLLQGLWCRKQVNQGRQCLALKYATWATV
jgi:hypothetical protein